MTPGFSFPKSVRLLKRADFLPVQASSQRVATPNMVFCVLPNDQGHVRVGFTVSRKFGKAVARNRIRRRLREAVRRYMPQLQGFSVDIVVLPRFGALTAPFASLLEAVERLVVHLQKGKAA